MSRPGFKSTEEYAELTPGDRIRIMCEFKGVSQAEVAQRARMHATHLSAVIRGSRPLGIALARRIAKALDVSVSYLIEGEQQQTARRKTVSKILQRLKQRVHRARVQGKPIGEVTERHIMQDIEELHSAI